MTNTLTRPRPAALPSAPAVPRGFFEQLSGAERAAIRLLGHAIRADAGSPLMLQGDPVERVVILTAGHAKVTRTGPNGHVTLLGIRDPGEVIGHRAAMGAARLEATTTALTEIEGVVISRAAFVALVDRSQPLLLAILQAVSEECAELSLRWAEYSRLDTLGRLASCLSELASRYGHPHQQGIAIALPILQDDLAAWTGSSRAGTAKALQTLRRLGWIRTARAQIIVRDAHALSEHAAA